MVSWRHLLTRPWTRIAVASLVGLHRSPARVDSVLEARHGVIVVVLTPACLIGAAVPSSAGTSPSHAAGDGWIHGIVVAEAMKWRLKRRSREFSRCKARHGRRQLRAWHGWLLSARLFARTRPVRLFGLDGGSRQPFDWILAVGRSQELVALLHDGARAVASGFLLRLSPGLLGLTCRLFSFLFGLLGISGLGRCAVCGCCQCSVVLGGDALCWRRFHR